MAWLPPPPTPPPGVRERGARCGDPCPPAMPGGGVRDDGGGRGRSGREWRVAERGGSGKGWLPWSAEEGHDGAVAEGRLTGVCVPGLLERAANPSRLSAAQARPSCHGCPLELR